MPTKNETSFDDSKPNLLRGINNVLEFGKHKGKTVQQVMKEDPNWLHWALQNISTFKLNRNALLLLPPEVRRDEFSREDDQAFKDIYLNDMGDH
jgi:hypothetical protein